MNNKTVAAIFDLDGLILDTEASNAYVARDVLHEMGLNTAPDFIDWYYSNCSGYRDCLKETLPKQFGFSRVETEKFYNRFIEYRIEYYAINPPRVKKGVIELLEFLKAHGVKMGICSASRFDQIKVKMDLAGASLEYFDAITAGDEVEQSKPHPQIYRIACERLGVKPQNAIAFEDTDLGIQSATSAGMRAILVPDVKPNDSEKIKLAFQTVESLDLAISILENMV